MTTDTPAAAPITAERTILAFGEGPWHVEHRTNAASDICDSHGRVVASCAWHEGAGRRAELLCDMLNSSLSAPVAAQPADSAMEVLIELADEVARVLPILVRAEDSGLWSELAAGTGVATTNSLVHVLQRARALSAASKERSKTHE